MRKPTGLERLYVDFDSFFASAEQHLRPHLRARPTGVIPVDSEHTGLIAVSREAKARGVKRGTLVHEARRQCPDLVLVTARHDAVIVGAGHNGLVAAAYLAKAGRKVLVLERRNRVGGILDTVEFAPGVRAPGIIHTVGRLRASVASDLGLVKHGLVTVEPDVRVYAPQREGPALTLLADAARFSRHSPGDRWFVDETYVPTGWPARCEAGTVTVIG